MNKTRIQYLVIFLCIFYVAVSPYITVYQVKSAAEKRDGEALSEYVDFVSLRQSFKDQMNAMFMREMDSQEMKDNPFAMLGVAFAGMMVDRAVEAYVTPAGITQLMSGQRPDIGRKSTPEQSPTEARERPFSDANLSYASFSKFVVTVQRDSDQFKFVLRRRGVGWKITEIILPLDRDQPNQIDPATRSDEQERLEDRLSTSMNLSEQTTRQEQRITGRIKFDDQPNSEVVVLEQPPSLAYIKGDRLYTHTPARSARNDVDRVINQAKGRLQAAYQRGLDDDPTMQGNVVIRLKIKPDGSVVSASIVSSALNNKALEERFLTIVRGLRFSDGDFEEWNNTYTLNFLPL